MQRPAIHVQLEGEFFTGMSFANVNEQLALQMIRDKSLVVSLHRTHRYQAHDSLVPHAVQLQPYLNRSRDARPDVTIRHAFPPCWQPPRAGRWVHIQPWEYGPIPLEWAEPLRDRVDEIWAPSRFVERCYTAAGVPAAKIRVIPYGFEPEWFHPQASPRPLSTRKGFRFLFVGPPVPRKGFDRALDAYLAEFTSSDDVCLIFKDNGARSRHRESFRQRLQEAGARPDAPEIIWLEGQYTGQEVGRLYAACHALVAPYRGEGFCLPVLEAMACGIPPIIPRGGPTDDFASAETAFLLPSEVVSIAEGPHLIWHKRGWHLAGTATELSVSLDSVRQAMRRAYENPDLCRRLGQAASAAVAHLTWANTVRSMTDQLCQPGRPRPVAS